MRRIRFAIVALALLGAGACDEVEEGATEGSELTREARTTELEGYDADTLAWFLEGRAVEFGGREWLVVGEPVYRPSVVRVGEFEGMTLYAPANETIPYDHLLFPLEDEDYWQILEAGTRTTTRDTFTRATETPR